VRIAPARTARAALPGIGTATSGRVVSWDENREPFSVMGFTVRDGKIAEIDVLADPERLHQLDLTAFE